MSCARLVVILFAGLLFLSAAPAQDFNPNDLNLEQRVNQAYEDQAGEAAQVTASVQDREQEKANKLYVHTAKLADAQAIQLNQLTSKLTLQYLSDAKKQYDAEKHIESFDSNRAQTEVAKRVAQDPSVTDATNTLSLLQRETESRKEDYDKAYKSWQAAQAEAVKQPAFKNTAILKYNFADQYSYITHAEMRTDSAEADYNWTIPQTKSDGVQSFHLVPSFAWGYTSTFGGAQNVANTYAGGIQFSDAITPKDAPMNLQLQPALLLHYKSNNQVKLAAAGDSVLNSETYEVVPSFAISFQPCDKWTLTFSPTYTYDYNAMNSRGNTDGGLFSLFNLDQYTVWDHTKCGGDKLTLVPEFIFNANTNLKTAAGLPRIYENWATVGFGVTYQADARWIFRTSYLYDAFNSTFEQHRALVEADFSF